MPRSALCLFLAVICAGIRPARAQQPFDFMETWSDGGLNGWTGGGGQVTLTNAAGSLEVRFREQGYPLPAACIARYTLAGGGVVTNISFRFLAPDRPPSAMRLVFFTTSGEEWGLPLSGITNGSWLSFSRPVGYSAGWTLGPRSTQALFEQGMSAVRAVGLFVLRDGSTRAQSFVVDDFRIQGLQPSSALYISGSLAYSGEQTGALHAAADSMSGSPTGAEAVVSGPGPFVIGGLRSSTDYRVSAFLDSNGNATRDFWEAYGEWGGNPAHLTGSNVVGAVVVLTDPAAADGLPYWWLRQHFDMLDPRSAGDLEMANVDSDADGMCNFAEYRAGTDPTNRASVFQIMINYEHGRTGPELRWRSAPGRTYALWSTEDLGAGFTLLGGGIPATGPSNVYLDTWTANTVKRFYRVEVE